MKKKVELPLLKPIYSTYHHQGPATAILVNNPSIRNWYLNQVLLLTCSRRFLNGVTTPELGIVGSTLGESPYLDTVVYNMKFLKGHVNFVIRNLLDAGYYVYFNGIDDYYVEGKSWYHEKHFNHDGCICGYDQENKTYCIYSYDKTWVYRKFWTPQKSFEKGRKSMFKEGQFGTIQGIKPRNDQVAFSAETALACIAEYLDLTIEKYPESPEGVVAGLAVHDYIAKYVGKLYDGSIPYKRMDRRIFRLIWEHKKAMLERITLIESELSLGNTISESYKAVVREADDCRMFYALFNLKKWFSILPSIQRKLLALKDLEQELLTELLHKAKGEIKK